jgi:DNA helicase HerA-like ATPase
MLVKIGEIICDNELPNHLKAVIQLSEGADIRAGQFVEIRDDEREVIYLGQIVRPHVFNPYYADRRMVQATLYRGDTRSLIPAGESWSIKTAEVRILSVISQGITDFVGWVPEPGSEVHTVEKTRLRDFFGFKDGGLWIGNLHYHEEVKVELDIEPFFYHTAILGTTGSGKSYAAGVLCEELYEKGLPVIIIDPHGEYRTLSEPAEKNLKSCNITEYSPPAYHIKGTKIISLRPDDLTGDDIIELAGLFGDQQQNLVYLAVRQLKTIRKSYELEDLIDTIEETGSIRRFRRDTIDSVINRIRTLGEYGILGQGFNPNEIVKPNNITVINLKGTETSAERILVAATLRRVFAYRKLGKLPKFVCVVEEAHRYAPAGVSTVAKGALTTIVKEGRKFGAGLIVVSQSPKDLDPDILKLCNNRIILRLDNPLDLSAVRPYLGMLPEELLEMLPFFPSGRAILSGLISKVPVIVDIRRRRTKHGGGTGKVDTDEVDASVIETRGIAPRDEISPSPRIRPLEDYFS